MGKTLPETRPRHENPAVDGLIAASSALYVLFYLFRDVRNGGSSWKQGDWLINSEIIDVRRSLSGDIFLAVSDALNVSPLFLVAGVQAFLVVILYMLFLRVLRQHDPAVSLLILATPAFFILFWPADPGGSLRKEIISFVAISALVYGIHREKISPQLIGCAMQVFAGFASEATIVFAPVFIALLLMSRDGTRSRRMDVALISIIVLSAIAALFNSVLHAQIADHHDVCRPLLERGLAENICTGAIWWLEKDIHVALGETWDLISSGAVTSFPLVYAFSFLPLLYLAARTENPRRWFAAIVFSGMFFVPLYAVGLDWGRWLSFHAFSAAYLLVVAIRCGHLRFRERPNSKVALIFLGVALVVTPAHTFGFNEGWMIKHLINGWAALTG